MSIHPTAVIDPAARLSEGVRVGPYAVIDGGVEVGPGCDIGPHVYLTGQTRIGARNRFHAGCVMGDAPQDLRYRGEPTELRIGDDNVFREHVTVHRSNKISEATTIGSNNLLMAHCHVGHNSALGNHIIIANGALLAGHVAVADRVFISGNCLVHQFVRLGTLAMMQGRAGIGKDLPPYTVATGVNGICGLNTVGLRRAGIAPDDRLELKRLYHLLFRGEGRFAERLAQASALAHSESGRTLVAFLSGGGPRGFCADTGGDSE